MNVPVYPPHLHMTGGIAGDPGPAGVMVQLRARCTPIGLPHSEDCSLAGLQTRLPTPQLSGSHLPETLPHTRSKAGELILQGEAGVANGLCPPAQTRPDNLENAVVPSAQVPSAQVPSAQGKIRRQSSVGSGYMHGITAAGESRSG